MVWPSRVLALNILHIRFFIVSARYTELGKRFRALQVDTFYWPRANKKCLPIQHIRSSIRHLAYHDWLCAAFLSNLFGSVVTSRR